MHAGVPTLPSMSRSPKPEIGGGGPVHSARTTLLGPDRGEQKLPLSDDEEAAARGTVLQERIRAAIARDDDRGIRDLARIVEECRDLASRSPELEDYVAFLARRGREGAVKRILGQTRRGRRLESQGLLVGAMLWIMEQEGCSQIKAAHWVRDLYPEQLGHKDVASINNDFGRYREHYELQQKGYFVPSEQLTTRRWIER